MSRRSPGKVHILDPNAPSERIGRERGRAKKAQERVTYIAGKLMFNRDIRSVRLLAFLPGEPGEAVRDLDVTHTCLRSFAHGLLEDLSRAGVLDTEKRPQFEWDWRQWWLSNRWKWGWSYEIDPITDAGIFPAPTESGFKPAPARRTPAPRPCRRRLLLRRSHCRCHLPLWRSRRNPGKTGRPVSPDIRRVTSSVGSRLISIRGQWADKQPRAAA